MMPRIIHIAKLITKTLNKFKGSLCSILYLLERKNKLNGNLSQASSIHTLEHEITNQNLPIVNYALILTKC